MHIVNLHPEHIIELAEAASRAMAEDRRFRLSITPERTTFPVEGPTRTPASVSYKVGEGMWSRPLYDQRDPYRSL